MTSNEKAFVKAFESFLADYELLCKRHGGIRLYVCDGKMSISNDIDDCNEDLIKPIYANYTYEEIKFYNLIDGAWEVDNE